MTMATFKFGMPLTLEYIPPSVAVAAGDVVVVGEIPCVAHRPLAVLELGDLAFALGVYIMAADAAYPNGSGVLWDTVKQQITQAPGASTYPFGTVIGGPNNQLSDGGPTGAAAPCLVFHLPEVAIGAIGKPSELVPLTVSGAIPPRVAATYIIEKAGVFAGTLGAPVAGTDDGLEITITSGTAFAHTLIATGLLNTGSANVNEATFAAFAGASMKLMAYAGKWNVLSVTGITFT